LRHGSGFTPSAFAASANFASLPHG
jgi:hypothetical protein